MIRILSDSTCDLSPELIAKYHIQIIPLYVRLGDEEFRDGVDVEPEQLFAWSDKHGQTPKTAAPSVADIEDFLDPNGKDEYIIFTISSSMSACYNNCRLAAEDLDMEDRVFVIDSENLSTGIGLQVLYAAELVEKGMSAKEIVAQVESIKGKVRASFVIDTMDYLYRGGRCSSLAAMLGSALNIHPRIAVKNGSMHPEQRYRGREAKFVMDYVRDMEVEVRTARPERVFITHSHCDPTIVAKVRRFLENTNHFKEIDETFAGAVVSSHCGPGTLGVLFIED